MTRRRADGRLSAFIDNQSPADGILPLVHITRAYAFDEMLDDGRLTPTHCNFFGESLIYLFYGRPAYRAKDGNNARLEFEWPIVLIFHPDKIQKIKRVFPFDTGAFELKMYAQFFDKSSKRDDFEFDGALESARKIVGAFYTNHKEYYVGLSRKNVNLPNRQFEAQGLQELSRLPGTQTAASGDLRDERSSAIEIQTSQPIDFSDSLLAIILPEPYLDDEEIKSALERWNVGEIETYPTLHNASGEVWVGQIYQIVRSLYDRLGYFK